MNYLTIVFVPIIPFKCRWMIYFPDVPTRKQTQAVHGRGIMVLAGWLKSLVLWPLAAT